MSMGLAFKRFVKACKRLMKANGPTNSRYYHIQARFMLIEIRYKEMRQTA